MLEPKTMVVTGGRCPDDQHFGDCHLFDLGECATRVTVGGVNVLLE